MPNTGLVIRPHITLCSSFHNISVVRPLDNTLFGPLDNTVLGPLFRTFTLPNPHISPEGGDATSSEHAPTRRQRYA